MTKSTLPSFAAIVLAAGKGARMQSNLPKVMHRIAHKPMIGHVMAQVAQLSAAKAVVVVAPGMDSVKAAAGAEYKACQFAVQEKQLGTGHAVKCAVEVLKGFKGHALILYGDTPLLTAKTMGRMLQVLEHPEKPAIVVMGMRLPQGGPYGRLVVDEQGVLQKIVEANDANAEEKRITLCNSGVMAVRGGLLAGLLDKLKHDNAKKEYYLTDIVAIAREQGERSVVAEAPLEELLGINSRGELADAERFMQFRLRLRAMAQGVTLIDPNAVYFAHDTVVGKDIVIHPHVVFGPGVKVEDEVEIRSFCHIEGAQVGKGSIVGPFARLRPGAVLEEGVHIGNFVEIKNSLMEKGAKANHLSYIGDAQVGAAANIGAGTITCNYDGFEKHRTQIGPGAFIGSNTALVAPVMIGKGAIIGAGSVISEDVEEDALAFTRSAQTQKPGWAKNFRKRKRN